MSVQEYQTQAEKNGPTPYFYSKTAEKRIVSGVVGYYNPNKNCEPFPCDAFTISHNRLLYVAQIVYNNVEEKERTTFNQILSTFKFTQ